MSKGKIIKGAFEEDIFYLGIEYQRAEKEKSEKMLIGWFLIIGSFVWFFFSIWSFNERLIGELIMLFFGVLALYIGYEAKKEMKNILRKKIQICQKK